MSKSMLKGILDEFPKTQFAMAYGSGIVPQEGYTANVNILFLVADVKRKLVEGERDFGLHIWCKRSL